MTPPAGPPRDPPPAPPVALATPGRDAPAAERAARTHSELETVWNVVVHDDPVNLMSYVTYVFQRIFGYSLERARAYMLQVHHTGRAVVWSGPRERAEFHVQQLHSYLLQATIEKAT